jgi:hypothetical protein
MYSVISTVVFSRGGINTGVLSLSKQNFLNTLLSLEQNGSKRLYSKTMIFFLNKTNIVLTRFRSSMVWLNSASFTVNPTVHCKNSMTLYDVNMVATLLHPNPCGIFICQCHMDSGARASVQYFFGKQALLFL